MSDLHGLDSIEQPIHLCWSSVAHNVRDHRATTDFVITDIFLHQVKFTDMVKTTVCADQVT